MNKLFIEIFLIIFHGTNLTVILYRNNQIEQQQSLLFHLLVLIVSFYLVSSILFLVILVIEMYYEINLVKRIFLIVQHTLATICALTNLTHYLSIILFNNEINKTFYIGYYLVYLILNTTHMIIVVRIAYKTCVHGSFRLTTQNQSRVYIEPRPCIVVEMQRIGTIDLSRRCCICMDSIIDAKVKPCDHSEFCLECISKVWPKCPICREIFHTIEHKYSI